MGDGDEEGEEADIHNEATILREIFELSNEPIGDDADNLDDVKGEEFAHKVGNTEVQLLGVPDGRVSPGPHLIGLVINRKEMPLKQVTLTTLEDGVCIPLKQSTKKEECIAATSLPPEQW
jgi:hypothetical protein